MNSINRREFLRITSRVFLTISGLLGLGMLTRFLGYQSETGIQPEVDLGLASDYPVGSRTHLPDIPAVLNHSQSGFTALSLTCTHLGCTLEQVNEAFSCPCHGSHFEKNGMVLRGPAAKGLEKLRVELNDAGHLILFRSN
ncbi:MAG TPA: Rieske (2Fe-2S) protein [Anaerolineales bacterium]|nr:Rieske (2Fe-2S) protein [Anaerolineales bacterium]